MAITSWAKMDLNIRYSTNYLMPAYVHFKADENHYAVNAKINVPLYNIEFNANGATGSKQFEMKSYQDNRNGKAYAKANINSKQIEYGKVKNGLNSTALTLPTFDLFTMAFQLAYYDKLPVNFQITNGKKLYPMHNVFVQKMEQKLSDQITEITYQFNADGKKIVVKKWLGEQFPRYISYNRDGDNYELEFDRFVE